MVQYLHFGILKFPLTKYDPLAPFVFIERQETPISQKTAPFFPAQAMHAYAIRNRNDVCVQAGYVGA